MAIQALGTVPRRQASLIEATRANVARRKRWDRVFAVVGLLATMVGVIVIVALLAKLMIDGLPRLSWDFFTSFPSRRAGQAGILSAWVGTLLVMSVTAVVGVTLGVAAGTYLEEYAPKNRLTSLIEINVTNLAGVPSIVYGLLALGLFVYGLGFGRSILSAGLTLALLILPIIIVATREAIRSVPHTVREAAYAVGATRWQVTKDHVIPYSLPGMTAR
jgi:phosphate transport system permease protein